MLRSNAKPACGASCMRRLHQAEAQVQRLVQKNCRLRSELSSSGSDVEGEAGGVPVGAGVPRLVV